MTNEERDIISRFIERISGAQGATGFGSGGSVPGGQPPLPPIDRDADQLIGELFNKYPEARYRLTQTAFVQEQALAQATARIQKLEADLAQAQQAAQAAAQQGGQQRSGGFFSSLFGGGAAAGAQAPRPAFGGQPAPQYAPPPQPQYAPAAAPQYASGFQPGMLGRGGSGFLGSALTTAAGVAGGLVVGNALMNMFEGHHGAGAGMIPGGDGYVPGGEGFIPTAPVDGGPWGGAPIEQGGGATPDAGYVDQGSWNTDSSGGTTDSSWTDNSGGGGGSDSWADSGGGGDSGGGSDSWT